MSLLNFTINASEILLLAQIALIFILAGTVKGVVGLGLPTLSMGLLAGLMAPAQAAVMLMLPSLLTNVWQMWDGNGLRSLVTRLWPLQLGVVVATLLVPVSLVTLDARLASLGLGAALALYAVLGLLAVRLSVPVRGEGAFSAAVGLITGAVTSATGVFVFPAVPYLQSLRLGKDALVQALGLSFTVSTLALFARLLLEGSFAPARLPGMALLIAPLPAALLGMVLGQKLRSHLDEQKFKSVFFAGLLSIGLYMLARGLLR